MVSKPNISSRSWFKRRPKIGQKVRIWATLALSMSGDHSKKGTQKCPDLGCPVFICSLYVQYLYTHDRAFHMYVETAKNVFRVFTFMQPTQQAFTYPTCTLTKWSKHVRQLNGFLTECHSVTGPLFSYGPFSYQPFSQQTKSLVTKLKNLQFAHNYLQL